MHKDMAIITRDVAPPETRDAFLHREAFSLVRHTHLTANDGMRSGMRDILLEGDRRPSSTSDDAEIESLRSRQHIAS